MTSLFLELASGHYVLLDGLLETFPLIQLWNYPALLQAFQTIGAESHDDYGRRANGVLSLLEKFNTFFGLKLSFFLFSATEQVSRALQAKNTTVQEALGAVNVAASFFQRNRDDETFERFYMASREQAKEYNIDEPVLPRYRRPPRRFDDGAAPHIFETPQDYYRKQYFEALDLISEELARRFDQKFLAVPKAIEDLLLTACTTQCTCVDELLIPEIISSTYSQDLNVAKLKLQLLLLPDLIKTYSSSQGTPNFKVKSLRTLAQIILALPLSRDMLSEVDGLLRLYFTIPVTTATAERSFSVLRRIKTYLRSTMTECRLNNVLLLHCHKDMTDNINIPDIAKAFISVNSRKKNHFGVL